MTDLDKVKELIDRSGHSFHAKVARWFASKDWHVTVSPYYMDQAQNKAREIDLIAERLSKIDDSRRGVSHDLVIRLYIECKYIASPSVFWFSNKDKKLAEDLVCKDSIFRPKSEYTKRHHYISSCESVAKLFSTSNVKGTEREPFYNALNQVLNGLISMPSRPPFYSTLMKEVRPDCYFFEFPVIVCSSFDKIYSVPFNDSGAEPELITDNFQLEIRYAYFDLNKNVHSKYFLIDIVEFNKLENFVRLLDIEEDAAGVLIRQRT